MNGSDRNAVVVIGAGIVGVCTAWHLKRRGADVTLIDPELAWTVDAQSFQSMSRNTPFDGRKLKGRAVRTIVGGKTVWAL